jgi:hypothetical protein
MDVLNENGSWGRGYADWPDREEEDTTPLIKDTAYRVIGYLSAPCNPLYHIFAIRGLEWLKRQVVHRAPGMGYVLYQGISDPLVSAQAALAFVRGYEVLGEKQYLSLAVALGYYQTGPVGIEWRKKEGYAANYMAYQAYHLSSIYRHTFIPFFRDEAVALCTRLVRDQRDGIWPVDEGWIWYHGMTLCGLIATYKATHRAEILPAITLGMGELLLREEGVTGRLYDKPGGFSYPDPYCVLALLQSGEYPKLRDRILRAIRNTPYREEARYGVNGERAIGRSDLAEYMMILGMTERGNGIGKRILNYVRQKLL